MPSAIFFGLANRTRASRRLREVGRVNRFSDTSNHQRFVRALLADELRWPKYDQEGCVRVQRFQEARWSDLVQLWASYNRLLAHILAGVPEEKRRTICLIGDTPAMSLEELAVDYLSHM